MTHTPPYSIHPFPHIPLPHKPPPYPPLSAYPPLYPPPIYLGLEGELGHLAAQAREEALLVQRAQRVQVLLSVGRLVGGLVVSRSVD